TAVGIAARGTARRNLASNTSTSTSTCRTRSRTRSRCLSDREHCGRRDAPASRGVRQSAATLLLQLFPPLAERAQAQRVQSDEACGVAMGVGDLAFLEGDEVL